MDDERKIISLKNSRWETGELNLKKLAKISVLSAYALANVKGEGIKKTSS